MNNTEFLRGELEQMRCITMCYSTNRQSFYDTGHVRLSCSPHQAEGLANPRDNLPACDQKSTDYHLSIDNAPAVSGLIEALLAYVTLQLTMATRK